MTKAELIKQVAALQRLVAQTTGTPPPQPADDRPRWRDGSLRNELDQLEETVDMERAATDLAYYTANRDAVRRLQALRAEREREQVAGEDQAAQANRRERRHARREAEEAAAKEAEQKREDARLAEIDAQWDGSR